MKLIHPLVLSIFMILITLPSCKKVLDVDSSRFLKTNNYELNTSNQGIYAMSGIFNQLQKVAERYVLLGELRGDLMDVTNNASLYLKQINNFEITSDNPYNNIKDYYAIINNCNYLIHKIDTSVISHGVKVLYKEYAATKAIRAWTYMQIALNYGKATYYENPILNIDDANRSYPQYSITELANVLVPDLQPWKDIEYPAYGQIGELNSNVFYFPIRFLIGELYLWGGQYEMAANEYHDLLYKQQIGSYFYQAWLTSVKGEFIGGINYNYYSSEILSVIGTTSENGGGSHLKELSWPFNDMIGSKIRQNMIKPSAQSIYNWDNQIYYDADSITKVAGDLRGRLSSYTSDGPFTYGESTPGYENYIIKFYDHDYGLNNSEIIPTCKGSLLYLRYAEAVNRLGKPNLAFAVLKNGLNKPNMANPKIVPASEIPYPRPSYMDFDTTCFNLKMSGSVVVHPANIGMHARGCGHTEVASDYVIPPLSSKEDSILYVEDQIKLELALETAFDGNRFHDLMRMAIRRNDPAYLANTVAEKYTGNKEAIRARLMDMNNWYLPKK